MLLLMLYFLEQGSMVGHNKQKSAHLLKNNWLTDDS